MDPQDGGLCQGERLWLWLALLLTSASVAVTENVALGKPAKMSSQFNSSKFNETSGPAGLAVNGNRSTTFRPINQYPDSPNCIHTDTDDRQPYWEVDLGEPYAIYSISIYWRNLGLVRGDGVILTVDGQLCHVFRTPGSDFSKTPCDTQLTGQTIRLSKNDSETEHDYYITVCEVEVWVSSLAKENSSGIKNEDDRSSLVSKRNAALGKSARMSSSYANTKFNEISGPACLAVNGNRNHTFRPVNHFPDSPNCIHTADNDREPFWEVDLGEQYSIASITIYWRNTNPQRINGVSIRVDGQLCYIFQSPVSNTSTITCGTPLTGQTVRLSKHDYETDNYYLTVCEVEVWVCLPGYFRSDCQGVCPQRVCENNQTCSPVDGTCPKGLNCSCHNDSYEFKEDFQLNLNKRNAALGKTAKMSSSLVSTQYDDVSGPACLAVNGDKNTSFRPINIYPDSPNCIHTDYNDREPFWEVDLGELYTIASIIIYWMNKDLDNQDGVSVRVDGQLCHYVQRPVYNPSNVTCVLPLTGRAVRLSKRYYFTDDSYFLTVCEVEVWVCRPGFYGSDCENDQVCKPVGGVNPKGPYHSCQNYSSYDLSDFSTRRFNTRNVALGKTARMSSSLAGTKHNKLSGPACLAVNGNRNTTFRPINLFPDSPNCIQTGENDREPFWEVDLGELYTIASITIYWRNKYTEQRNGVNLTVDGQLCHVFRSPVSNPSTVTCDTTLTGRTVRMSKHDFGTSDNYFLTVCEVEVWGMRCSCQVQGFCNFSNQDFPASLARMRNVAIGKPAKVIAPSDIEVMPGFACLAVDGQKDNYQDIFSIYIMTSYFARNTYWEVDLGEQYDIGSITIYWHETLLEDKCDVRVDGQLCNVVQPSYPYWSRITCYRPLTGQTISLSYSRSVLIVSEVEVWVCFPGFFGPDCGEISVGTMCKNSQMCIPENEANQNGPKCSCQKYGSCEFHNNYNKRNVALGKVAKMSSFYANTMHNAVSGPACLAVNGKTNTTFRPFNLYPDSPNCVHTGDNDRQPYWEVDLGEKYVIDSITIYWMNKDLRRINEVHVTIDGQLCHVFYGPFSNPSTIVCGTSRTGQTVRLSKDDNSTINDYFITVCEVEVWGDVEQMTTRPTTTLYILPYWSGEETQHLMECLWATFT